MSNNIKFFETPCISFCFFLLFRNVTMKVLGGMQWASENLADDVFYSTCDDDMIVDIGRLQKEINRARRKTSNRKWSEFPIICGYKTLNDSIAPGRSLKDKNYVSKEKYRWHLWPKFCLGGLYTTSVSVAKQLYDISRTKNLLNTDDVWITGILRNILGMPDSMLIKVEPAAATHQKNFKNLSTNEIRNNVTKSWKKILARYKRDTICIC